MTVFGRLTGPSQIEKAVLETLEAWMPSYLAEVERQNVLPNKTIGRPPVPESYRGGLDWQSVKEDWLPAVVVICNPLGEPERKKIEAFSQNFQTEVGCVLKSEETTNPEGIVRRNAGLFAAASMGAIVHHSIAESTLVEEVVLTGAPRVEFFESENRRLAVGITTYHVWTELINPSAGPLVPKATNPEEAYPEWTEAKTHSETVAATPITEAIK